MRIAISRLRPHVPKPGHALVLSMVIVIAFVLVWRPVTPTVRNEFNDWQHEYRVEIQDSMGDAYEVYLPLPLNYSHFDAYAMSDPHAPPLPPGIPLQLFIL